MLAKLLRPDNPRAVLVGVFLVFLSYFVFALNDAIGKALVVSFGVAQVVVIRSIGGFLILGPLLAAQREQPFAGVHRPILQIVRATLATADTGLFYAACVYLPLADVITFYMAGPIYVAVASRFILKEHVGWRRWTAIFIGFIGVLIALRPSEASFSPAALFAITGSVSYSLSLVVNKLLVKTADSSLVTYQTLVGLVAGGLFAVFDWRPLTLEGTASMLLLGLIGTSAHLMLTRSVKLAPVSVLAPFQYTLLLWGIILGFIFFGDVPSPHILAGAAVIVLAGLFIFHRKAKLQRLSDSVDIQREIP